MVVLSLLIFIVYLWLCWYLAEQFYEAAVAKGFSSRKYFWITFWLGPIGYALVIALPDRGTPTVYPGSETYLPEAHMTNQDTNITALYDELPDL